MIVTDGSCRLVLLFALRSFARLMGCTDLLSSYLPGWVPLRDRLSSLCLATYKGLRGYCGSVDHIHLYLPSHLLEHSKIPHYVIHSKSDWTRKFFVSGMHYMMFRQFLLASVVAWLKTSAPLLLQVCNLTCPFCMPKLTGCDNISNGCIWLHLDFPKGDRPLLEAKIQNLHCSLSCQ